MNDANWRKPSLSFSNGNCAEVANLPGDRIGVRDTRDRRGPVLGFSRQAWERFTRQVKVGAAY